MRAWIFQANPDEFDLAGYLAAASDLIMWQVNQYAKDIADGDQVFLWQAIGSGDREAKAKALANLAQYRRNQIA